MPSEKVGYQKEHFTQGIYVSGAREHNLKSINVWIPRNKMTVVTGLSGSGKSSLVFDTIYAEGQRRYVESLSSYARFFIDQIKKPDVDFITGLSPSVAIDQRSLNTSPRSTVGTVTETYDYLRLLFARLGKAYCVEHGESLESTSVAKIANEIMKQQRGKKFFILAPVARGKKGEFVKEFNQLLSTGYSRARVDGQWVDLSSMGKLSKRKDHFIDVLIDRLTVDQQFYSRLKESLQRASDLTDGYIKVEFMQKDKKSAEEVKNYSLHATCPICFSGFVALEPKLFSFNNPKGACVQCNGLGYLSGMENESEIQSDGIASEDMEDVFERKKCSVCQGSRLNSFALNVKIKNKNIADLSTMSVEELSRFCSKLKFQKYQMIADKILDKIQQDLNFFLKIGLSYLSLDRPIRTLSGGEAQRIRLMSQISSPLIGVLYILDEPSIGLHPVDHDRLLEILFQLRNRGNTVLMVEHDEKTMRFADHLIDMGPEAGCLGGQIIAEGNMKRIMESPHSITGAYLSEAKKIPIPSLRRPIGKNAIEIKSAKGNNLKKLNVHIPLGCLVGVTGISGSGKSTLVVDTLYKALLVELYNNQSVQPAPFEKISGLNFLDKVVAVNQKPIGRTPRSIPATYIGIMTWIRQVMSLVPESRMFGYTAGDFSFNIKGGRCEHCLGTGQIKQEMLFLPSAVLICDICQGRRYSEDILNIRYKGKNIHDILSMDVVTACQFYKNHIFIKRSLELLKEVGLGYLTLGQSSVTLSGGEAQRIKLTKELAKKNTGRTLYILDEPTTGLHFQDIKQLIFVLKKLVDKGSTVIVIEHQMDVIKSCDYIIDLGPGGGRYGGHIVAQGTPNQIACSVKSVTAPFLRQALASQ